MTKFDIDNRLAEHQLQNQIRDVLAYYHDLQFFRANVGCGWIANHYTVNNNGTITLDTPRWFNTGLPKGFPDLFGYKSLIITPDMVDKRIAQFAFAEVKRIGGKLSKEQAQWIKLFKQDGAIGDVVYSPEGALKLFRR